jgi:hypothetical protein
VLCCLAICVARIDVVECFLFVYMTSDDINVIRDNLIGCCVREVVDERWYVYGEQRIDQCREMLNVVMSAIFDIPDGCIEVIY